MKLNVEQNGTFAKVFCFSELYPKNKTLNITLCIKYLKKVSNWDHNCHVILCNIMSTYGPSCFCFILGENSDRNELL